MNTLARPVGRPKKKESKTSHVAVRFSEQDYEKLKYICTVNNQSSSDAIRNAVDLAYELNKRR